MWDRVVFAIRKFLFGDGEPLENGIAGELADIKEKLTEILDAIEAIDGGEG